MSQTIQIPEKRESFPSSRDDPTWPGVWKYGIDNSEDSFRVIAVNVGGNEIKYGLCWIGPVDLRAEGAADNLEVWAESVLYSYGGYIHLFPADGDARDELKQWTDEIREDEADDEE